MNDDYFENSQEFTLKGLECRRSGNGFFVAKVHYSADPHKDPETPEGAEWHKTARRGMPDVSWRKEYEIDWFARSGQLVYPGFRRDVHVISPFSIPPSWPRYMAIDPGLRNPTAALWAAVDPENAVFLYDEYYQTEKIIQEHCRTMRGKEGETKIFLRLIDPSACGRNLINKRSNREEYARHSFHCIPANNELELGIDRVNSYLAEEPSTGKPSLYFFSTLTNTINEIQNYRWEEIDPEAARLKNLPERPVKKDDHLMDCLRYILVSDPRYFQAAELPRYRPHTRWDGMTTGY